MLRGRRVLKIHQSRVLQNGLINPADASKKLTEPARDHPAQRNHGLGRLELPPLGWIQSTAVPLMVVILLTTTIVLMFLAFGSVVLQSRRR